MRQFLLIKHKNGREFDTEAMGLKIVKFHIPPLQVEYLTEKAEQGTGSSMVGYTVNARSLTLTFDFYYKNVDELRRMESDLSIMFLPLQEIIVVDSVQPWKQYVVTPLPFTLDEGNGVRARVDVELVLQSGLAESINTFQEIFTISQDNSTIEFNNTGTYEIDQRDGAEMSITFRGVSSGLIIENLTTGEVWSTSELTTESDTLVIKEYTAFLNGVNIFPQTNKRVITFAVGSNMLRIKNATGTLTIDSRMYFR